MAYICEQAIIWLNKEQDLYFKQLEVLIQCNWEMPWKSRLADTLWDYSRTKPFG